MKVSRSVSRRALVAGLATMAGFGSSVLAAEDPEVNVTKDPNCGCCGAWVARLRTAGFKISVTDGPVNPVKVRLGVPRDLASCHTAQVGPYVLEGHVPVAAIRRLLAERPSAIGLAVPGMPAGSPGMEVEGAAPVVYEVILFGADGRKVFGRYRGGEAV